MSSLRERLKALLSDSAWSIAGLMLMNVVAQFAVYPVWSGVLGDEQYGNVLYLIALMNVFSISAGSACNYARMRQSADGATANTGYLRVMGALSALALPVSAGICLWGGVPFTPAEAALFALLVVATLWRFYADVEYRLSLNYKGYFLYYAAISAGYLLGIAAFRATGLWPLALLPGEAAGLILVLARGRILRRDDPPDPQAMRALIRVIGTLLVTNLLSNAIFNGDRFLLKAIIGGEAVTVYYLASLLGKTATLITTPLNSVVIGYLMRYKGGLDLKLMRLITLGALALILLGTAACTVASHVIIRVLYPANYPSVAPFFILANLAQVVYFITNMLTVVLLRFTKTRHQLTVNLVYAAAFVVFGVTSALRGGVAGFCLGMLAANAARMLTALWLGFRHAIRSANP